MPAMPKDISWLSPKRRRTTGNVQHLQQAAQNGQTEVAQAQSAVVNGNGTARGSDVSSSPPVSDSPAIPSTPATPATPTSDKRPKAIRPVSQPVVHRTTSSAGSSSGGGDSGNLFYAYARKGDDLKSRYLLTFASATVANEWWLHVQHNFPDSTRPGPQLFSFKTDDLLARAWKHPSLEHLKSKWMYIAFSDATGDVGGAAQGIIPVQDADGHMLGSSAGRDSRVAGELRKETKEVKNHIHRLEEHFEKMMEAMEKNTERVAELAGQRTAGENGDYIAAPKVSTEGSGITYFDMDVLSGHFNRMNDLLQRNNDHIDGLVKKHDEHEEQLRGTIQIVASAQKNESFDLANLSAHLDRMQQMMEHSITERKDSANDLAVKTSPQIDFSPLADRLEKVQEAIEQNSALIRALFDEGANESKPTTPFWGRGQQPAVDLSPLTGHLERIHSAIEQQNEHNRALTSFAGRDQDAAGSDGKQPTTLAPLVAEHLEQIYNAIEEGNKNAVGGREYLEKLLKSHDDTRKAVEAGNSQRHIDDMLKAIEEGNDNTGEVKDYMQRIFETQLATRKAVEKANKHSAESKDTLQKLLESQNDTRGAILANGGEIDFTPMADHLESIRESSDANAKTIQRLLETQQATHKDLDFTPLSDHLGAIRSATDRNNEHIRDLVTAQKASGKAASDFTPVTDRLKRIHNTLEKQASERRESSPGTGDARFIMNALSSHLSKIQAVTEQNAQHMRMLREKHTSSQDCLSTNVSETSEQIRSLITYANSQNDRLAQSEERVKGNERRLEQQGAQMREMMSGQREMVEVMRSLAKSITAKEKGQCDHVVVPPPRKMGRKVVGFVYDAKEGPA